MRMLIASGIYRPDIGGPATYVERLADELTPKGHTIDIVTYSDVARFGPDAKKKYTITRVTRGFLRHIRYLSTLFRQASAYDVIYAQDPVSVGVPALLVAWLRRKKLVLKIVGDTAWETYVNRGGRDLINPFQNKRHGPMTSLLKWLRSYVARHADHIIVPSKYLQQLVQGWGVPTKNISVVYNAPDIYAKRITKRAARSKLKLPMRQNILLSAGRIVFWKGFETLIGIMHDINAKLLIAGDGPERSRLEKLVHGRGLQRNVIFLGKVAHDKLTLYFRAADAFVLNTGYEGFPHVILEAMALDCPVITTRIGGVTELVRHHKNGLLVSYEDAKSWQKAIQELLGNQKLQNSLARAGQKTVRALTWNKLLRQTLAVFNKLFKARRGG